LGPFSLSGTHDQKPHQLKDTRSYEIDSVGRDPPYLSSRSVAAFPPDGDFARIVIGTHPDSRKNTHVLNDSRVVLSYVDNANRGYLTRP
jgi:hypothetical protein